VKGFRNQFQPHNRKDDNGYPVTTAGLKFGHKRNEGASGFCSSSNHHSKSKLSGKENDADSFHSWIV
jgi:hypothetical protein